MPFCVTHRSALFRPNIRSPNPQVEKIVSEVSEKNIAEILQKLESFGTRNILSTQDNPTRGVGAARKWIYDQFRSYSPKLEVSFDQYTPQEN